MTATDELRAMLDEFIYDIERLEIKLDSPAYDMTLEEYEDERERLVESCAESIVATLEVESDTVEYERNTDGSYRCTRCGCVVDYDIRGDDERIITMDDYVIPFNFCPKCGAEVVEE